MLPCPWQLGGGNNIFITDQCQDSSFTVFDPGLRHTLIYIYLNLNENYKIKLSQYLLFCFISIIILQNTLLAFSLGPVSLTYQSINKALVPKT